MKKLFLLAAAAAGVVLVRSKLKQQEAESLLWAEATKQPNTPDAAHRPEG